MKTKADSKKYGRMVRLDNEALSIIEEFKRTDMRKTMSEAASVLVKRAAREHNLSAITTPQS